MRDFSTEDGGALVHLHNLSGGVLGGDRLELMVEVCPEAIVQLTTTGATRLYRSRPKSPAALQLTEIRIAENGLLEYLPDPLIPFAGSRYRQETTIHLASGAGLFWWEVVAPGREARGELFEYQLLHLKSYIATDKKPLAIERIKLEPVRRPLSSPVRFGPYRYFSSFYICKVDTEALQWRELETELAELAQQLSSPSEILWGVSALASDGLCVRALSLKGLSIGPGLLEFWRAAKRYLYGRAAIPPRKVH